MSITLDPASEVKDKIKSKIKLNWTWEHVGLGGILLVSAFLNLWNLTVEGYSNSYYAAAVRSMMQSWHNFFYVSFDPGGFVTVDKPPVAFWVQTIFAKIFGFNGVSLLLPEALAGIGGVFLVYYMVKRAFGTGAGLLSGLLLAITPIFVVMNRNNNPDGILVFTLILSAWALLRAAEKGQWRWLILSGVLVSVAFNVKMLEAYVVLPAFYLMYFLFARTSWIKRIFQLAVLTLVIAVASFSWPLAVDLTPASNRPYVDSSTTNSELDLIFGYNGLGRVDGNERGNAGGAPFSFGSNPQPGQPNASGSNGQPTNPFNPGANRQPGQDGGNFQLPNGNQNRGGFGGPGSNQNNPLRLIVPQMAGEFNWFMPLALLGLIFLSIHAWFGMAKGEERSRRLQSVALWGGWLLIFGIVFSMSKGIFHSYYLTVMAPAEAALAGITIVMLWRSYREGRWFGWLLPVGLVAATLYQAYILTGFTSWNWWLGPVLIVAGITGAVGLVLGRLLKNERFGRRLARGIVWVTMACLLVTPAIWSIRAVFTSLQGSMATATPSGGGGGFGFGGGNANFEIPAAWLNFVKENLSGQLLMLGVVAGVALVLLGLRYLLRMRRLFNLPVLTGVLLAFFLVSSAGWWINVAQAQSTTSRSGGFNGRGGFPGGPDQTNSQLLAYLEANQDGYKYLMAVSNSQSAAPIIIETGRPVMSIGGFLGGDQTITSSAQLQELVANHTVRYFMLGGGMGGGRGNNQVSQWVQQNCQTVNYTSSSTPNSSNGNAANSGTSSGNDRNNFRNAGGFGNQALYVCGG